MRSSQRKRRIGELLVEAGLITTEQLSRGLQVQEERGGRLVEVLVALGYIDTISFVRLLASQPGVASIDLANYHVSSELLTLIPKEIAQEHEVFPIDKLGRLLTLGMACPLDSATIHELEERTGLRIKPLLCSVEDIRNAIAQYYPVEAEPAATGARIQQDAALAGRLSSALRLSSLASLIRQIETLPALPETVQQVRDALENPEVAMRDIADIIKRDAPIAAKVLKVANSAAYGLPNRVTNLDLAISLLGLREAYAIVLSATVSDLFKSSPTFDYHRFWTNSILCAAAMKMLSEAAGLERDGAAAFAAGLLLHIGRIALIEVAPERCAKVDQSLSGRELVSAELENLGIAYPEAGYELVTHWGLPPAIAEAIRFHHSPEQSTQAPRFTAFANLADRMTRSGSAIEHVTAAFADSHATLEQAQIGAETLREVVQAFFSRRKKLAAQDILG